MTYGASLINLIDQRIDHAQVKPTKMGTVLDRDSASARATVSLDGSSGVPQPVKCFESVVIDVGDRVGLIRFEGEWIIVGNYTPTTWADVLIGAQFISGNTTSGTFVDMPGSPSVAFVKVRDSTQLQLTLGVAWYAAGMTGSGVTEFAYLIRYPDGVTTLDLLIIRRGVNLATTHADTYGGLTTVLTLPAGGYSITARWRRVSGNGTLTVDANDQITMHVKEVIS